MLSWLRGLNWRAWGASVLFLIVAFAPQCFSQRSPSHQAQLQRQHTHSASNEAGDISQRTLAAKADQKPQKTAPGNQQTEDGGCLPCSVWKGLKFIGWWWGRDPNAFFAGWVAIFTLALVLVTNRQIKLGRDEFNPTHRPEIIIHSVEDAPTTDARLDPEEAESFIGARVTYFNKGVSAANDIIISAQIIPISGMPEPGIQLPTILEPRNKLVSGTPYDFSVFSRIHAEGFAFDQSQRETWDPDTHLVTDVYCIGTISYADGGGIRRQTGFCWKWRSYSWVRVDSSGYEYAY